MAEFQGGFKVILYKDHYSEEQLKKLGLNERQIKAVKFVKNHAQITNAEYQEEFDVARRTATRDLKELVEKGVLKSSDMKGAGAYYEI